MAALIRLVHQSVNCGQAFLSQSEFSREERDSNLLIENLQCARYILCAAHPSCPRWQPHNMRQYYCPSTCDFTKRRRCLVWRSAFLDQVNAKVWHVDWILRKEYKRMWKLKTSECLSVSHTHTEYHSARPPLCLSLVSELWPRIWGSLLRPCGCSRRVSSQPERNWTSTQGKTKTDTRTTRIEQLDGASPSPVPPFNCFVPPPPPPPPPPPQHSTC